MRIRQIVLLLFITMLLPRAFYFQDLSISRCDSLFGVHNEVGSCKWVDEIVEFERNYDSVKADFYQMVKDKLEGNEDKSLVVSVIVDSLGNGVCSKVNRGITAEVDSIGIEFMLQEKYKPCKVGGKTIEMNMTVILLNRRNGPDSK